MTKTSTDEGAYMADKARDAAVRMGSRILLAALQGKPAPEPIAKAEQRTTINASDFRAPVRLFGAELVKSVANDFGLTIHDLRGQGRFAVLVDARSVVARIMRDRGLSYPQIGRFLGGRDHSTTINLVGKFDIYERRNPKVRASYARHIELDRTAA